MKANELRIGNIVLINGLRTEVSLLVLKHVIEENIQFTVEGISLTEEILLKCGMTKNNFRPDRFDFEGIDNGQFHIDQLNGRFVFRGLGMTIVYVDYLHDLQNLHFACKRNELNTSGIL